MIRFLFPVLAALFIFTASAQAEEGKLVVKYFEDQPYQKLNKDDPHPMDEMIQMAETGDTRAQFILGDLYSKGQGGLPKDLKTARAYFERSARHGENFSFIRLAALAKREKNAKEAYMWYTLAADRLSYGPARKHALTARDALAGDAPLSQEDVRAAKTAADDWKMESGRLLREERAAEEMRAKEEKEKQKMAQKAAATQPQKEDNHHEQN